VYRNYEDKKGATRYITEIVLNDLVLLRSSKDKEKDKDNDKDEQNS
jgi:single-stranded DNA-binding protein